MVKRRPVLPPEIAAKPESAAVAGWEQLTVELTVPGKGMRHLLVVLDATGRAISASDMVMYRAAFGEDAVFFQETVGGRLEQDGTFRGTRWRTLGLESAKVEEAQLDSSPSAPTEADAQALQGLVAEIMKRSIIAAP